jgi:hypothetical protein
MNCVQTPQVSMRRVVELRPHPSYVRHQLSVSASQLSALAALGSLAFREPIVVTRNRTIVDGYARFQLAQRQERETLFCLEYDLTEEEALRWLIQSHRPSWGLNAFSRVLLVLELEPFLQERARANQQIGGQHKGSSNLTEAQKVDSRSELAAAAGVSPGNIRKVKQLIESAHPMIKTGPKSRRNQHPPGVAVEKAASPTTARKVRRTSKPQRHEPDESATHPEACREAVATPIDPADPGRSSRDVHPRRGGNT